MRTERTVALHHRFEGPEDVPVLVLSNPDASLEVIPDDAHFANAEQPEIVTQEIIDHLVVREGR